MHVDEQYMARALQLAELGRRVVAPNPMVGCVIVHNDSIIGEGYHILFGGPHAEVNAINSVEDQSVFKESILYVTLEPCSHHGKTPPCSDLIVAHNFKRVVVGSLDPNKLVNGKGIERLRKNDIEVTTGVLEKQCEELNKHFFTAQLKNRPYVLLKWAQTKNGLISDNEKEQGFSWISTRETQKLTHLLRSHYHGILVGRKTVENDNPTLNVRAVNGIDPIKIIIDPTLSLSRDLKVFTGGNVIVINTCESKSINNVDYIKVEDLEVETILGALFKKGIQSIMVEGGAHTLSKFIQANQWDEAVVITGDKNFNSGVKAPDIVGRIIRQDQIETDLINFIINP